MSAKRDFDSQLPRSVELLRRYATPPIILGAILLLAFALRLAHLNFQPLWWDEGYSLYFATRTFGAMLDATALDIHPPLYYAHVQLWTTFAGTSDYAVRFLSLTFGVIAVAFIYPFAKNLSPTLPLARGGKGWGLTASFLFAIAPIEIYYSQEVRMYGLVTLLCLASTYFFVRLLTLPVGARKTMFIAALYIVSSAAALYTEYYAAFVLVLHFLYVLIKLRFTFYALRHWLFAWASIAILYLPWVIYAGGKLYNYVSFKVGHEAYPAQDPVSFLAQHLAAFSVGHVSAFTVLNWASIAFIALATLGAIRTFSPALFRSPAPLLLLYLFIPLLLGYAVNVRFPFHPVRYERLLILASPAFFLLVEYGVAAIKRSTFRAAILTTLGVISALSLFDFYSVPRYPNDDYRPLIAQVQTLAQPGDNFLAIYPWQIGYLESYYRGAPLNVIETPSDAWANNPAKMQSDVNALLAKNPRVWLPALQTLGRIIEDSLDAQLRPSNYAVLDTWFGTTRLELFQCAEDAPPAPRALQFDGGELARWGVSANPVVSGQDIARAWFDWGESAPKKLSLRLIDAKGNIWAQDDRDIERGMQRVGLAIPAGTPPGEYDLRLALYRANESAANAQSIGTINVTTPSQPSPYQGEGKGGVDFGNGIKLLGYDAALRDAQMKPGFNSGVTFFWQTTQKQSTDYLVSVLLLDAMGQTRLDASDVIARGVYGSSQWRGNELVRDPRTFTVPGDLADGTYTLAVALIDPITKNRIGSVAQLTQVQVKGRAHYFGAPAPAQKSDARVGDIARLAGYDVERSGRNLQVVVYWQALGRGPIDYKVFLHVVDANGKIIAQKDQTPGGGDFPTTTWVKGEYLVDAYEMTLPSSGDYQIRVGMYDPGSGARLPVFDAAGNQIGDFVTLK